jgi:uncharacterized protein DUF4129
VVTRAALALHGVQGHGAAAIRDTVERVFRGPSFDRTARGTLGGLLWRYIEKVITSIFDAINESPALRTTLLWTGFGLIGLFILRFLYVAAQRGGLVARGGSMDTRGAAAGNPWQAAQRAAAQGNYTEAAHYLYAALLVGVARKERLRLHPSKTAGDYVRELRRRSSPAFPPFRSFVRSFEFIIYGRGECDRAQFEALRAIAAPLVGASE